MDGVEEQSSVTLCRNQLFRTYSANDSRIELVASCDTDIMRMCHLFHILSIVYRVFIPGGESTKTELRVLRKGQ